MNFCHPKTTNPHWNEYEQSVFLPLSVFFLSIHVHVSLHSINPPTTTRVKISKNVDILPKVYLVHLKVEHGQTLRVVLNLHVKMSRLFLTGKIIVLYSSGWSK